MPAHELELLSEADQLKKVSAQLELLAENHPKITEALLTIAGTILHTATLLEVLVTGARRQRCPAAPSLSSAKSHEESTLPFSISAFFVKSGQN